MIIIIIIVIIIKTIITNKIILSPPLEGKCILWTSHFTNHTYGGWSYVDSMNIMNIVS